MSDISGLNQWLTSTDSVVSDCERMAEKIKEEKQRIRDALQQLESQSADVKAALDSVMMMRIPQQFKRYKVEFLCYRVSEVR